MMDDGIMDATGTETHSRKVARVLSRARYLQVSRWSRSRGVLDGLHRFRVPGGDGIEFEEVREYTAGDDLRRIDWNVSARYGGIYVKEFVAERNLDVYIVMDVSGSTAFGGAGSKRDTMMDIGASLALSALRSNNRVGLGAFAEGLVRFIPAKKGRRHAVQIIHEMVRCGSDSDGSAGTNVAGSLVRMAGMIGRRCVMFVISDFLTAPFGDDVRRIGSVHDVVMLNVSDMRERDIPDVGYACVEDAESGAQMLVDTSDKGFRRAYRRMALEACERTRAQARCAGADYMEIAGEEPFDAVINRHTGMLDRARAPRGRASRQGRHA